MFKVSFQVLKFIILYSENSQNSFKMNRGHTPQLYGKLCLYQLQLWHLSCQSACTAEQTLLPTQCQLLGSLLVI